MTLFPVRRCVPLVDSGSFSRKAYSQQRLLPPSNSEILSPLIFSSQTANVIIIRLADLVGVDLGLYRGYLYLLYFSSSILGAH